jgi:hypothetical protein
MDSGDSVLALWCRVSTNKGARRRKTEDQTQYVFLYGPGVGHILN